jgi:HlyD family secretion protein
LAVIALTLFVALRPRPILVDVAVVRRAPMRVQVSEDGQTRIRERYVVSTPLTGRLLRVTYDVGDSVIADKTVLARMEATDPTLLDPRAVAQAKSRVGAAERKLQAAKAELARVEAMLQFAEREMGRMRQLVAKNAASDRELAENELLFQQRTEEARAAGFAVDIAEYELELERDALLLTDPERGDSTEMELSIRAPIDGRILRIYQESTTVVQAGSPLMEVGDPTDLEVVADVLSRDAVQIAAGNPVHLRRWGGEVPLDGRVRLVEPSGFTKLSALGVEEQRVNVIIDLINPREERTQLGDGFRVDCEITVWQAPDVLQVPTSALFRVDEKWQVFVVDDSQAKLTEVEIGKNNGRVAQVLGGIEEGVRVVTHPGDAIEDGVRVAERQSSG